MKRLLLIVGLLAACAPLSIVNCQLSITRERVFTGSGLYGFMNGGAELYMEYGVMKLVNRDVVFEEEDYTIDIYEMPSAQDAFGIYSMNVFRCQRADTLGCIDCLSPYQLLAVVGNKYVSVVFPSGSYKAQQGADRLIRYYLPDMGKEYVSFPLKDHTDMASVSGKLKYLRGPISVSSASRDLAELLQNRSYSGVWLLEKKTEGRYFARVLFTDKKELKALKKQLAKGDIIDEKKLMLVFERKEKENDSPDRGPFGF